MGAEDRDGERGSDAAMVRRELVVMLLCVGCPALAEPFHEYFCSPPDLGLTLGTGARSPHWIGRGDLIPER